MKRRLIAGVALASFLATPALTQAEQLGKLGGALKRAQQLKDVQMTEAEEVQLGTQVSQRIRTRYGVVQSQPVHKYVALVGTALALASSKPTLKWTFIVLDTDAVNAFAAPGGFVHITKGALANLKDESELAGVLAHEIIHVTDKHTIRAIQKGKLVQMGADETAAGNSALMGKLVDKAYEVIENGFGRGEELEADERGVALANTVGYAPQGMNHFLAMLMERNKTAQPAKNGLFASHPETKERVDKMTKEIASAKLTATATVQPRYGSSITFKPVSAAQLATIEKSTGGMSSGLTPSGGEKKSAQVTGSGAARGVGDEDRLAKGGPNPAAVAVAVGAAELTAFKTAGGLK